MSVKKERWTLYRVPDGKTPSGGTFYRYYLHVDGRYYRVPRRPARVFAVDLASEPEIEEGYVADLQGGEWSIHRVVA
jgi:hypothetical protein